MTEPTNIPDLASYDVVEVSSSGGKQGGALELTSACLHALSHAGMRNSRMLICT